jgi:hypothetical protein
VSHLVVLIALEVSDFKSRPERARR